MAKKSDYFFLQFVKNIGLFINFKPSLFTIHYFLAYYSLFIIKKGHYSLIIITHPGPLLRKDWPIGSLVYDVYLSLCHFSIWCPGSGMVLDCINLSIPDICLLPYFVTFPRLG